ncbi:hypothetical protein G9A89_000880, partial [Geosiphon pyriformis]
MSGSRGRHGRRGGFQQHHHGQPNVQTHHHQTMSRENSKLSRVHVLVSRIQDEKDPIYTRRFSYINQLSTLISEPSSAVENLEIFETVTRGVANSRGFESIFEDIRVPTNFKIALARLLGQIAANLNNNIGQYIRWLFDRLQSSGTGIKEKERERKTWLLGSLKELFSRPGNNLSNTASLSPLRQIVPAVINELERLLDSTDCAECLSGIIEVLEKISDSYPTEFGDRFQDIIDLLVGWHIDTSISDTLHNLISDSFKRLRPFWSKNLEFAYELLSHFLADMEVIACLTVSHDGPQIEQTTRVEGNKIPNSLKGLLRACHISSCFNAVVDTIGAVVPSTTPDDLHGAQIKDNKHPYDRLRAWVIKFLLTIADLYMDLEWFEKGNHIILALSSCRKATFIYHQVKATEFLLLQIKPNTQSAFIIPFIEDWLDTFLQAHVLLKIMNPKSPLMILRRHYSTNSRLFQDVLDTFRTLLRKQNSIVLDTTIKMTALIHNIAKEIKNMIEISSKTIYNKASQSIERHRKFTNNIIIDDEISSKIYKQYPSILCLLEDDISEKASLDPKIAAFILAFDLEIIVDIAKQWSLEQETFWIILLLLDKMGKYQHSLGIITSTLVKALHQICYRPSSPGEFDSNSFKAMLSVLSIFLQENQFPINLTSLSIEWIRDILENSGRLEGALEEIKKQIKKQIDNLVVLLIFKSRFIPNVDVRLQIPNVIRDYIDVFGSLGLPFCAWSSIANRINDIDPQVQNEFLKILDEFNPFYALSPKNVLHEPLFHHIKARICTTPHLGSFRPPHFQIVMMFLGMKDLLSTPDESDVTKNFEFTDRFQWRERLFHSCQSIEAIQSAKELSNQGESTYAYSPEDFNLIDNSKNLLHFWALWETTRYCILSRLRTPFGGPTQTFDAFENRLNALTQKALSGISEYGSRKFSEESSTNLKILRDLLTLIDRLENQIYNASMGTALGNLPPAPRGSLLFFRTNRQVCEDWFRRVRPTIVKGGIMIGDDSLLVIHGFQCLADQVAAIYKEFSQHKLKLIVEFQEMLMLIVQALVRLHSSDSIHGLLAWCKRVCNDPTAENNAESSLSKDSQTGKNDIDSPTAKLPLKQSHKTERTIIKRKVLPSPETFTLLEELSFDWMHPSILFAEAKYETAIEEGTDTLKRLVENQAEESFANQQIKFLTSQIIDAYCQVDDLESLSQWLAQYNIKESMLRPLQQTNKQYLEALAIRHKQDSFSAWEMIVDVEPQMSDQFQPLSDVPFLSALYRFRASLAQTTQPSSTVYISDGQAALSILDFPVRLVLENSFNSALPLLALAQTTKVNLEGDKKFISDFLEDADINQKTSFSHNFFIDDLSIWGSLKGLLDERSDQQESPRNDFLSKEQINTWKLFLAKISRKKAAFNQALKIVEGQEQNILPQFLFEKAKILHSQGRDQEAIKQAGFILEGNHDNETLESHPTENILFRQRVFLKLAKWLKILKVPLEVPLKKKIEEILINSVPDGKANNEFISQVGSKVEACLWGAVHGGYSTSKAWYSFATYYYQRGIQVIEEINSGKTTLLFLHDGRQKIQSFLRNDWNTTYGEKYADWDLIFKILYDVFIRKFNNWSAFESIDENDPGFTQLQPWASKESIEQISTMFHNIKDEILGSFTLAVDGYFKFLNLSIGSSQNIIEHEDDEVKSPNVADMTTAVLRILRLFLKYSGYLKTPFVEGFDNIDAQVWEIVIPQLFSRLDHPDPFVQQQLCKLLCKIAQKSPQSVVYHTVVSFNSTGTSEQARQSLKKIADSLDVSNGVLIAEIRHVIAELQRITVLWEELWLNKITGIQLDVNKRLHKIEKEFDRINDNLNLNFDQRNKIMKESYEAIMKPVVTSLDRLYNKTNIVPSTPHEEWFSQAYGNRIREAYNRLRVPSSWDSFKEGWNLFKSIHKDLVKELQTNRSLKLADVSPFLATIKSSAITMPGLPSQSDHVTIQSFDENITILPTKTKPKKLNLLGSDGRQYGYLFKGLEDLHLDERIMQLLQITNDLLRRDKQARTRNLSARYYAVIPLSDHSGMIQWVNNATQMFTLYKRWQHRERLAQTLLLNTSGNNQPTILQRPSDMFFEKIGKALKKEGMSISTSRRNWPASLLQHVFLELVSETPSDLLEKEVWCSCTSPAEWWKKSISLSRSLAVMSVIGYIIGLGDRHLDNILIDFETGEVIHIDYNVCFEKGRKLRVPETVPFRLTSNIEKALGLTGVDGVFRIACENVLRIMRENKEIFLFLLEAFVYDPLVDWHHDMSDDRDKQVMDFEENLSLLTSRIEELKNPLEIKQDRLLVLLKEFVNVFENFREECINNLNFATESLNPQRISDNSAAKSSLVTNNLVLDDLKSALSQRAAECSLWHAQHEKALQTIQADLNFTIFEKGPFIEAIYTEVFSANPQFRTSVFTPFINLISTDESLLENCEKIDQEFFVWIKDRDAAYKSCIEHLQHYRDLISMISQIIIAQDYYSKWPQILHSLLDSELEDGDFEAVFQKCEADIPVDLDLKEIRNNLKYSWANYTEESVSINNSFAVVSAKTTVNNSTQQAILQAFLQQIAHESAGPALGVSALIFSLSPIKQYLTKDCDKDIFEHLGFDHNFQISTCKALLTQVFNDPSFINLFACGFAIYHNVHLATVIMTTDDVLPRILTLAAEQLQMIGSLYALQSNFESVVLPRIFQVLHAIPNAFQIIEEVLYVLSTETFKYWQLKHPEAHSIVINTNEAFSKIRDILKDNDTAPEVQLLITAFDELFGDLELQIRRIRAFLQIPLPLTNDEKYSISELVIDDFIMHKLNIIANVLTGCQNFLKENLENQRNPWFSALIISENFINNSDSLARLRQIVHWCIIDLIIPNVEALYASAMNRFDIMLRSIVASDFESSNYKEDELLSRGLFFPESLNLAKKHIQEYVFFGCEMNSIHLITSRKSHVDFEAQQWKMEYLKFEWINGKSMGEETSIQFQFLESLQLDVNIFMSLDKALQDLGAQYMKIHADVDKVISSHLATTSDPVTQSFGDISSNQQILFAQELERMKHIVNLCNSILHLETFRTASDKTLAMDKDTLQLVKKLEIIVQSNRNDDVKESTSISPKFSDIEPSQLAKELSYKIENVAAEFHSTLEEIRLLMTDLMPLVELVSNIELESDEFGKEARSKAKEIMVLWAKLDFEGDSVIKAALILFEERLQAGVEIHETPDTIGSIER